MLFYELFRAKVPGTVREITLDNERLVYRKTGSSQCTLISSNPVYSVSNAQVASNVPDTSSSSRDQMSHGIARRGLVINRNEADLIDMMARTLNHDKGYATFEKVLDERFITCGRGNNDSIHQAISHNTPVESMMLFLALEKPQHHGVIAFAGRHGDTLQQRREIEGIFKESQRRQRDHHTDHLCAPGNQCSRRRIRGETFLGYDL